MWYGVDVVNGRLTWLTMRHASGLRGWFWQQCGVMPGFFSVGRCGSQLDRVHFRMRLADENVVGICLSCVCCCKYIHGLASCRFRSTVVRRTKGARQSGTAGGRCFIFNVQTQRSSCRAKGRGAALCSCCGPAVRGALFARLKANHRASYVVRVVAVIRWLKIQFLPRLLRG